MSEPQNHKRMFIPDGTWKKSDYAIGIKILELKIKEEEIHGSGYFAGYYTKEEIEKLPTIEWQGKYGSFLAKATELSNLRSL